MLLCLLAFLGVASTGLGEVFIVVKAPAGCPYNQRIRLSSFEEANHYLGGGDESPNALLFEVLHGDRVILSTPVKAVPVEIRRQHSDLSNAGRLSLLWSEDCSYLTIVERYDLGRPALDSLPTAVSYWLKSDGAVKLTNPQPAP